MLAYIICALFFMKIKKGFVISSLYVGMSVSSGSIHAQENLCGIVLLHVRNDFYHGILDTDKYIASSP